jgi:hypothetical protein
LVPSIDGSEMLHFENVGLYDALFVMQDVESKTLWNHITGEAMYGPHVGRTLGPVGNMLQMNVTEALEYDPDMQVAISERPFAGMGRNYLAENSQLSAMFIATLGEEDTRRPRMDMGLGIFTAETRRYYPMEDIREAGAIIDELDGQGILVFIDTQSMTPAAMFVEAESATVAEREVHLDTGEVVRSGVLYDSKGVRIDAERPQQLFTRWYGYALTFPGAEIYGQ